MAQRLEGVNERYGAGATSGLPEQARQVEKVLVNDPIGPVLSAFFAMTRQ